MIKKTEIEIESKKIFSEKQKMLKKVGSVANFYSMCIDKPHKYPLKSVKTRKQQEKKLEKKNNYSQKFFEFDECSLHYIEDGALFDDSADEAEYDHNPHLQRFYKKRESKRRYTHALHIFRDKAYKKIESYSNALTSGQKVSQYLKESFISQAKTYQEKHKKCSLVYHEFQENSNSPIETRYEFLYLVHKLVNELNYPTGFFCTTGFELTDAALKEANLPKLTCKEKDSIKQGIILNDEYNYIHPIIT